MKKFLVVVALLGSVVQAQDGALETSLAESITAEDLKKHLVVLASDEYEGRETGEPGQRKAAEYIQKHFESLGLLPVGDEGYFQRVPLKKKQTSFGEIKSANGIYKFLEDFYFFGSYQHDEADEDLVFLGYGVETDEYSDYSSSVDVKGKVAMIMEGEPMTKRGVSKITKKLGNADWSSFKKAELAERKGVSVLLIVKENFDFNLRRMKSYLGGASLSLDMDEEESESGMHIVFISPEMADGILKAEKTSVKKLRKRITKKGPQTFQLSNDVKMAINARQEKVRTENVLGFIEGSDPELKDEVLVLTAHYDHIGVNGEEINNGADDDGSGTVTILELAEAFQKAKAAGKGPRRSVLFMTVSGEEKGLLGSKFYVENPVFPLENTIADLNIDMIGRVDKHHEDGNYVYLIGSDRLSSDLHKISEDANTKHTNLLLDYKYNDPNDINRFYYRSDHYNFAKKGIPVIFYFSGVHEDYHKPTDTVEKIDFEKMEKIAQLVFHTAWELANTDERPVVDQPVPEEE